MVLNGDEFTQPVTIIKRKRGRERGREGGREEERKEGREGGRERGREREGREGEGGRKIKKLVIIIVQSMITLEHMKLHYDVLSPYNLS